MVLRQRASTSARAHSQAEELPLTWDPRHHEFPGGPGESLILEILRVGF
jgi:hypothetical protein